jgi:hypothetical protein
MALGTDLKSMDFMMFARASEGLGEGRGIIVSFVAMMLGGGVLLFGLYAVGKSPGALGGVVLFICWILTALIAGTGLSAAGIMVLDRARIAAPRSTSDALLFGLICFLKACVVALVIFIAALLFGLAAALVYFLCKIPVVGPIVLFIAHPLLVVAAGLFAFLTFVFAPSRHLRSGTGTRSPKRSPRPSLFSKNARFSACFTCWLWGLLPSSF